MNKASFGKLSASQQKILMDEAVKAGLYNMKVIRDGESTQIEEMKKNGMEVNTPPDMAPFAAATQSVWDALKAKVTDADWKTFQDMLAKSK